MVAKLTLLLVLGLGASGAAAADDLDTLIDLEKEVKQLFDKHRELRGILDILDGVGSGCLRNKCFGYDKLKIKVKLSNSCDGCKARVDWGEGAGKLVPADGNSSQIFLPTGWTVRIGNPTSCEDASRIQKIKVFAYGLEIESVELLWIAANGEKTIFIDEIDEKVNSTEMEYLISEIKDSQAFKTADEGSCQN